VLFLSLVLQDYRIPVCPQLLVMIMIAGRLSLLGFVFKPVSWLAGDSRLRQTFSLRIHLVEWQSLNPICPSTIISSFRSHEAAHSTSASRSIAGPIVFGLDRNKPVTVCHLIFFGNSSGLYVVLDHGPVSDVIFIGMVNSATCWCVLPI